MPKIAYEKKRFGARALEMIDLANTILVEYDRQGFVLTLRQLYYQFVSRGWLDNKMSEYKRLGSVVNDARLAGYIDWNFLEDRTRELDSLPNWGSPADMVEQAARWYHRDLWLGQDHRVEVWIEKDALVGVIEQACRKWDIPFFSCRGYTSQSEMWRAGQRLVKQIRAGYKPVILHLGDHDPSGRDMTRDIRDRLFTFIGSHIADMYGGTINFGQFSEHFTMERIALNWDQIEEYSPPPNPAKLTDTRAQNYIAEFGYESWELDALEPRVIEQLIEDNTERFCDVELWNDQLDRQEEERSLLTSASDRWDEIKEVLSE